MQSFSKVAALAIVASLLAACSGGGSLTPNTQSPTSAKSGPVKSSSTSRFVSGAATATNSQDFTYNANPPTKELTDTTGTTANGFPPPSVCESAFGLACYTPRELKSAYDIPSQYDGTGQTIVIIDAYGSPTIQRDLASFDAAMGVPNSTLNVVYPGGQPTTYDGSANRVGWASETSLDVEWAHAIAPAATIDLVIAPTNSGADLGNAEAYAIQTYHGSVVSMSYGASEYAIPGGAQNVHLQHDDQLFQSAQAANVTMIASAGDLGATNGKANLTAEFPASDPSVLSVGGTNLFMSDTGAYQSENVWNDTDSSLCPFGCAYGAFGATGGAPSVIFRTPAYQQLLTHAPTRQVADVAYNASVYTGVLVAESFRGTGTHFYFTGGTSAGSPQWAGIIALANQAAGHPLGFVNETLYTIAKSGPYHSAFHDVTIGQNALFNGPGEPAGAGYDMPSGLGSPDVANLISALQSTNDQ